MVESRVDLFHGLPLVRLDRLVELVVQVVELCGGVCDFRETLAGVVELQHETPRLVD